MPRLPGTAQQCIQHTLKMLETYGINPYQVVVHITHAEVVYI